MRTALDAPLSALDEHERKFVANIRTHGWHDMRVAPDEEGPGFSYTTGFWLTLGVPEVIVFSLKPAHDVLWDVFRDIKAGRQIVAGKIRRRSVLQRRGLLLSGGQAALSRFLGMEPLVLWQRRVSLLATGVG